MSAVVGFFGKLPAHGDFVRRGLPGATAALLDDWLQAEFGRDDDPAAAIAALAPVRFASTAIAAGQLGLGVLAASADRVGRTYVVAALRLSDHVSGAVPAVIPPAWDDWCGRAEALLVAARDGGWTADATQGALTAATRASVAQLVADPPFAVPDGPTPATAWWRPTLDGEPATIVAAGLPRGPAFDRLIGRMETRV